MARYLTADGKSVLAGNLYDAQGNNLSSTPLEKRGYAPMSQAGWVAATAGAPSPKKLGKIMGPK